MGHCPLGGHSSGQCREVLPSGTVPWAGTAPARAGPPCADWHGFSLRPRQRLLSAWCRLRNHLVVSQMYLPLRMFLSLYFFKIPLLSHKPP